MMNKGDPADPKSINLDQEVDFSYPEGIREAAAVLDFIEDDDEKLAFVKALSRTLQ